MSTVKDQGTLAGCLGMLLAGVIIVVGYRSCSEVEDRAAKEREQAAIAEEANDRSEAAAHGMSFDDYRAARWASNEAYAACRVAAEGRAKHQYKADWIPDYTWDVKGKTIAVVGRDLQMQNGFGVFGRVTYFCDWNMVTKQVASMVISE